MAFSMTGYRVPLLGSAALLAALFAVAMVFAPGLSGGFALDDFPNIVHNAALTPSSYSFRALLGAAFSSDSGPLARPLTMLSFALQIAGSGLAPYPLKLANLAIHLANGALIFFLCRGITQALRARCAAEPQAMEILFPVAVSAAWLLAPINLTAVLYVVQRMESLAALFTLLGLLAYLHGRLRLDAGRPGGMAWMAGGLVLGSALAALAKETGVLLPAYAFVLEWVLFGFRSAVDGRRSTPLLVLFAAVLLVPGAAGVLATLPGALSGDAYASRPFGLTERLLTEARVVADYLRWIAMPDLRELGLYHDDYPLSRGWVTPASTLPAVLLLVGLLALALWLKGRRPLVSLGLLFFFVGHGLVSTYLPLELVYEHRNYLPSFGIFLAVCAFLMEPRRGAWRVAGLTLVAGLIGLGAITTFLRAGEWAEPGRLAYLEATRHPASPRANYELGRMFGEQAKDPNGLAFSMAVKSFESAADLPNSGLLPLQAQIVMKARLGRPVEGELWERMKMVIESRPLARQDITALHALISCQREGRCRFPAERLGDVLELAHGINPADARLHTLYANYAANVTHDRELALRLMNRAVALAPRNPQYWENLISLQTAMGQHAEARVGLAYLRELNRFGTLDATLERLDAGLRAVGERGAAQKAVSG